MKQALRSVAFGLTALVSACSAPSSSVASDVPSSEATSTPTSGGALPMRCEGSGSPTVVFEAGDNSGAPSWDPVYLDVAEQTRVCAYTRAGIDEALPATECRQLDDLTADLEGALAGAGEPGPYVFVAASGGGFIVTGFANDHPERIAGVVFVDVPRAIQDRFLPPDLEAILKCDAPTNSERRDYVAVEREAWSERTEIGDIPVSIISATYGPDATEEQRLGFVGQRGWLVLSPQAVQVAAETGHDVTWEEPGLVLDEIFRVLEAAR